MAKLTKAQVRAIEKLLKTSTLPKAEPKPLDTLKSFMQKQGHKMVGEPQNNNYKLKDGTTKQGQVVRFSNGGIYQLGTNRFWRTNK